MFRVVFVCLIVAIVFENCLGLVRLASWNLLAQVYCKADKYPWCEEEHLQWQFRKKLIVPTILDMNADVICLQEVQVDLWPDLFQELEETYDGILQDMAGGHNVASAVLVRKSCPLQIDRIESRSRALLAILEDPTKQSKLYLG